MNTLNFSEKIKRLLEEKRISERDIQIWGGEVKENGLQQFISKWDFSNMPFVIIETLKELTITRNFNYSLIEPELIERIRIFGKAGDLDLRRNGYSFIWRYVGQNSLESEINGDNFWEKHHSKKFFVEEKDALLWGNYNQDKKLWHDDRVAKAKLSYPVDGNPKRVKIYYKTLSESGCISFVWFMEIKGDEENE